MLDTGYWMLGQGSILTAKERESNCAAREILQSSLPFSRSLMNDSEWVVNSVFYHPLASLARGREDGRTCFRMLDTGYWMLGQGSILTAKERESGCAAREILQSSLPSSRSLMNDSEWVVNSVLYHPLAALARGREAERTGGLSLRDV
jgi:hypothetical protein